MIGLIWVGLVIEFSIVIKQDFRERAISWWLIPLLIINAVILGYWDQGEDLWRYALINGLFVLIQLMGLSFYFSAKEKKIVNITHRYLGIGDVLFFIPLCFLFSPLHFILFFVLSLTVILALFKMVTYYYPCETIPLAGGIAFCVPFYCLFMNQYDDWKLLIYLYGY